MNKLKNFTNILCDTKLAIVLTENLIFHSRNKHISIKFHYTRELVENDEIEFEFCSSKNQVANAFTKPIKADVFKKLKMMIRVIDFKSHLMGGN